MTPRRPVLQDRDFAHCYERLRASQRRTREHHLLIQRGVSAWLHVWANSSAYNDREHRAPLGAGTTVGVPSPTAPTVPDEIQGQVAHVLVNMVSKVSRS